jgi:hypothetical protein
MKDLTLVDIVNGFFEFGGGLMCWLNVRKILADKTIRGFYWPVQAFFAIWGWWNLFYYTSLAQPYSFWGALFLAVGNTVWVLLAIYFRNN